MWLFSLPNNTVFISTSDKLIMILFSLRPRRIITLNIVVGLDEYLLIIYNRSKESNIG